MLEIFLKLIDNYRRCIIGCIDLENKVRTKLAISFLVVPITYVSTQMSITMYPNTAWELQCDSNATTFTCEVYLERMNVSLYITHPESSACRQI